MNRTRNLVVPVALVAAGALGGAAFYVGRPAVRVESSPALPPLVRVIEVTPRTVQLRVETQGTVAPRTEANLVPEVSGPVVWVAPVFERLFGEVNRRFRDALARSLPALSQSEIELRYVLGIGSMIQLLSGRSPLALPEGTDPVAALVSFVAAGFEGTVARA